MFIFFLPLCPPPEGDMAPFAWVVFLFLLCVSPAGGGLRGWSFSLINYFLLIVLFFPPPVSPSGGGYCTFCLSCVFVFALRFPRWRGIKGVEYQLYAPQILPRKHLTSFLHSPYRIVLLYHQTLKL